MVCFSPHVLVYGVFLTPCTSLWCVSHPMYWSMVCSSSHVLVYGVFLTPCNGLWCVPHPMYWSMVWSSPHVLVYGLFLTPRTDLWWDDSMILCLSQPVAVIVLQLEIWEVMRDREKWVGQQEQKEEEMISLMCLGTSLVCWYTPSDGMCNKPHIVVPRWGWPWGCGRGGDWNGFRMAVPWIGP